jgi:hypothetical protein
MTFDKYKYASLLPEKKEQATNYWITKIEGFKQDIEQCLKNPLVASDVNFYQIAQQMYYETSDQIDILKQYKLRRPEALNQSTGAQLKMLSYFTQFKNFISDLKSFELQKTKDLV